MKKVFFFAATVLLASVAFSQNSIPVDSVNKVVNNEGQQINLLDSLAYKVLDKKQLKELLESKDKKDGITIVGYNVIIGNNNTIVVVDDQAKSKDYLKDSPTSKIRMPRGFFERYAFGAKASTMGVGAELAVSISRNITFRGGYNYSNFKTNDFNLKIDDEKFKNATVSKDYNPSLRTDVKFKQSHAHALIDFYPLRNGIFHLTGGVYLGDTKIQVNGQLVDNEGNNSLLDPSFEAWPKLGFHDKNLAVNKNGSMDAELRMGNFVKPYAGIGLGRAIPSNRFGIKFELGLVYNGDYKLMQNGVELPVLDNVNESFENAGDYTKYLKFWPVVSFQIIYRLK